MQPDPTPDLDNLELLEKAATPGRVRVEQRGAAAARFYLVADDPSGPVGGVIVAQVGDGTTFYTRKEEAWLQANADALAAARNALPWLLRAARERDELRAIMSGDMDDFVVKAQEEAMAKLRARAEKAEARAKELEAEREARMKEATAHYRALLSMPETRIPSPEDIEAAKDALREAEPCLRADNWHGAADQVSAALAKLEGR